MASTVNPLEAKVLATSINGTSWNWGVTATDVMIDGSPWFLCDAQTTNGRGTNGGCPSTGSFCGAVVWKPAPVGCSGTACTDSNAEDDTCNGGAQGSPCSATFDLKAMFQWLETHDPPGESYPYVEVGSSVNAIDSGFETSSTGGVARTFASSGFTVDAVPWHNDHDHGSPNHHRAACDNRSVLPDNGSTIGVLTPFFAR